MGLKIDNITDEIDQSHIVTFEESEISIRLLCNVIAQSWSLGITYKERSVWGVKLSAGVLHVRSSNFPFDFTVADMSGAGIDPYKRDDFSTGRCVLYLLNPTEMEALRGGPVPI
jgi:hypothetical protein